MSTGENGMSDVELEFHAAFAAPPERVFAALTQAEHLAHWLADAAESDPRVGGRLVLRWHREDSSEEPFEGEWVAFQAQHSCAFTGGHSGYPDGSAGRVEFTLEPAGAGTRLVTRHRMPPRIEYSPVAQRYTGAWPRALDRLTEYLTPAR